MSDILEIIRALQRQKKRIIVALDGRCAAGKTTLSAHLRYAIGCNVIPMDHFFLRPWQRTSERLAEPGGNIDYERFLKEALVPLIKGGDFSYCPFDCREMKLGKAISVKDNPINLVEGSYSCHPALFDYYDLRLFLTVAPKDQLKRIRERGGQGCLVDYVEKWIPLEERYFSAFDIQRRCDYSLTAP